MKQALSIASKDREQLIYTGTGLPLPTCYPAEDPSRIVRDVATGEVQSVPGVMNYITSDTQEACVRRDVTGDDLGIQFSPLGAGFDPTAVTLHNARGQGKTLHTHGFELHKAPLDKEGINFLDTQQVIDDYYPSCERILRRYLGGSCCQVYAFDHNIRINQDKEGPQHLKGAGQAKAQIPIGIVHADYTLSSGPARLKLLSQPPKINDVLKTRLGSKPLLDDEAVVQEALDGKRRFAFFNAWRNIDVQNPVQELPLACVEAPSASPDDLKVFEIVYSDRIGENYWILPSPKHKWCYFPNMTHDEVILLKQWDSVGTFSRFKGLRGDEANDCSTFSIHSAFADPSSPLNAPPRKSIEVRCVVIWDVESET